MNLELKPEEVIYKFNFDNIKLDRANNHMMEYDDVYEKVQTALEIEEEGYNIYLIDDFSKDKLEYIMDFIKDKLKEKKKPKDICYVAHKDEKNPKSLLLPGGKGKKLKDVVGDIQKFYADIIYDFYNSACSKEKEIIVDRLQKKRSELLNNLVKISEDEGFIMKPIQTGFTFIPIKDSGEVMSEKEYEDLGGKDKDSILNKVSKLKNDAQDILDQLKDLELGEIEKIKVIITEYFNEKTKNIRSDYLNIFIGCTNVLEFLDDMCNDIESDIGEIYSINYDDDEEQINEIIYRYEVNVIVDNSENEHPPVIFEEDPSIINLLGTVEYENKNGVYVTDISLIRAGSLLKSNEGCLVLKGSSLFSSASAYHYFKKCLLSGKVNLDYNRTYLDILSLTGLRPEPIKFNSKIILIGDYETYNLLYTYDEDFKKIFKLRTEYNSLLNIDDKTKESFLQKLFLICKQEKIHPLSNEGISELAKFSSRKAESRNKLYIDDYELNKVMMLANNIVKKEGRNYIEGKDIRKVVYSEDLIEKEINENYKEKKIFIDVKDNLVGVVNGLSVIDIGYLSFGKPIRITCCCYKGSGEIVDVQKESDLSGKIHTKAINILRGYINNLFGNYEKLSVDFHLSFEQLYGKIDGDSASVAEVVSMISALSKIPIKQNIAVTGSINQFGQVQPIGGVNEKIEGFFKVCKLIHSIEGKGVLIPESNKDSLILNEEVEKAVNKGLFHIYTMESIQDAVKVLMGDENTGYQHIIDKAEEELKKYYGRHRKNK